MVIRSSQHGRARRSAGVPINRLVPESKTNLRCNRPRYLAEDDSHHGVQGSEELEALAGLQQVSSSQHCLMKGMSG
jgi:hypothetical protein